MLKKSYEAFTLIEMLVVTGILLILMVLSAATARFATERAREVEHKAAAQQIFDALQSYSSDQILRLYPSSDNTLTEMLTKPNGLLVKYLDPDNFNGGQAATYFYFTNGDDRKKALVCVTLGGIGDAKNKGILCVGDGFNDEDMPIGSLTTEKVEYSSDANSPYQNIKTKISFSSEWGGKEFKDVSVPGKPIPDHIGSGEEFIIDQPIEIDIPGTGGTNGKPCLKPGDCGNHEITPHEDNM